MRFFPNPASEYLYVAGTMQTVNGSVLNMLGQKVMDFTLAQNRPLDIRGLPKGTYLLCPDGKTATKLIKN